MSRNNNQQLQVDGDNPEEDGANNHEGLDTENSDDHSNSHPLSDVENADPESSASGAEDDAAESVQDHQNYINQPLNYHYSQPSTSSSSAIGSNLPFPDLLDVRKSNNSHHYILAEEDDDDPPESEHILRNNTPAVVPPELVNHSPDISNSAAVAIGPQVNTGAIPKVINNNQQIRQSSSSSGSSPVMSSNNRIVTPPDVSQIQVSRQISPVGSLNAAPLNDTMMIRMEQMERDMVQLRTESAVLRQRDVTIGNINHQLHRLESVPNQMASIAAAVQRLQTTIDTMATNINDRMNQLEARFNTLVPVGYLESNLPNGASSGPGTGSPDVPSRGRFVPLDSSGLIREELRTHAQQQRRELAAERAGYLLALSDALKAAVNHQADGSGSGDENDPDHHLPHHQSSGGSHHRRMNGPSTGL